MDTVLAVVFILSLPSNGKNMSCEHIMRASLLASSGGWIGAAKKDDSGGAAFGTAGWKVKRVAAGGSMTRKIAV